MLTLVFFLFLLNPTFRLSRFISVFNCCSPFAAMLTKTISSANRLFGCLSPILAPSLFQTSFLNIPSRQAVKFWWAVALPDSLDCYFICSCMELDGSSPPSLRRASNTAGQNSFRNQWMPYKGVSYIHLFPLMWVSVWMWLIGESPLQKPAWSVGWLESTVSDMWGDDFCE